jgi:hypothetical protein
VGREFTLPEQCRSPHDLQGGRCRGNRYQGSVIYPVVRGQRLVFFIAYPVEMERHKRGLSTSMR